jgi:hypothetical protein
MVRLKVPYTFVKHVDSAFVEMAWDFFATHLHPKYDPTQYLSFFIIIFISIFFFVRRETNYGGLQIENTGILQRPPQILVSEGIRDHAAKFGTIPALFWGRHSST